MSDIKIVQPLAINVLTSKYPPYFNTIHSYPKLVLKMCPSFEGVKHPHLFLPVIPIDNAVKYWSGGKVYYVLKV